MMRINCCLVLIITLIVVAAIAVLFHRRNINCESGKIVNPSLIEHKIPSGILMVANPCSCLRNSCFSPINRNKLVVSCTAEDWWNPSMEKGDLARKLERVFGRYSCIRFIIVAATYVCDKDVTCFEEVTEETLAAEEATTELIDFVWESTKLKKCNLGEKPVSVHWTSLIKNDAIISRPLAKLIARLIEKAKEDFAEKEVERLPFWTFCSNTTNDVLPSLFLYLCKEYGKIKKV